jgi:hypothetical protein
MDKMLTPNRYILLCKQWLSSNTKRKKEKSQNKIEMTTTVNNMNPNPMRYIIRDYCLKYPTDPRDQDIHEADVVRPPNHLWETIDESRIQAGKKSIVGILTYGTCYSCSASGPAYKNCIACMINTFLIL